MAKQEVYVPITSDATGLKKGLKSADRELSIFGKKTSANLAKLQAGFGALGASLAALNVVAVKVLQHVGVDRLRGLAADMGISTLSSDRFGLALTLGGGEVRLLDLAAAYAAFANGGHRGIPPRL